MGNTESNLVQSLGAIVGEEFVSEQDFVRRSYTRTPSWVRGKPPAIVVRPESTEEVSAVMKLANQMKTPVVPRGGGASVTGFLVGDDAQRSICMDTTRMNRVLSFDEENLIVDTQCGIVMSKLSSHVSQHGFHMNTVDMPQYIDTLGGALSGFNGGGEPSDMATEGEIGSFLVGLEVVLPTGEVIRTGSGPGTNIYQKKMVDRFPGSPDMTGMFVGDAGIFGIKTRAAFHVFPRPETMIYGAYGFETFDDLWAACLKMNHRAPYPYTRALALNVSKKDGWTLFWAIRGDKGEVALKESILRGICEADGGFKTTDNEAMETIMRFSGRQLGKWFASRGKFLYFEYIFSKSEGPGYLDRQRSQVTEKFEAHGLMPLVTDRVSYIVPKERHSMVMGHVYFFDENRLSPEQYGAIIQISDEESENVLKNGGFMESNHGYMTHISASAWSEPYRAYMKTLKRALDPNNILNPGLWRL